MGGVNLHLKGKYKTTPPKAKQKDIYPGLTYVDNPSRIHSLHPLIKLALLFCFGIMVFAVSTVMGQVLLFCLLLTACLLAQLGSSFFLRRLRFIFIFCFFIFLVQALTVKEGFLIWRFSLGYFHLSLWSKGPWEGLRMAMRFINIIGSSFLFVATTDPNRLAYALMQVGLPYRHGFALITALRFIPVFHLELEQVKNAQAAKGIELEGLSPKQLLRALKYILLPLVVSSLSRVDNLTLSMEGRAFGLHPQRTYMHSQVLSEKEKIVLFMIPPAFLLLYFICNCPAALLNTILNIAKSLWH